MQEVGVWSARWVGQSILVALRVYLIEKVIKDTVKLKR